MNVLSLFDGMSCGRIALERAGISVSNYFSSEIDKYAIQVSQANYPDIIRLGDITKWKTWDLPKIDLIIGGSPCQGFSFAGKQLAFDDPRSKLFFEFLNIYRCIRCFNPKVKFLLENVKMKPEILAAITDLLGVEPICINSTLVSAQNRVRYYWTNIEGIFQPQDRGIHLKDILQPELYTCRVGGAVRGRRLDELGKSVNCSSIPIGQYLEIRQDSKSNCLTTVQKDNVVSYIKTDKRLKIKFNQGKASCLTGGANSGGNHSDMDILVIEPDICRRYSVLECERLQTLPEGYTENKGVSDSQRYKMIGNGWTVDVIEHIFCRFQETKQLEVA